MSEQPKCELCGFPMPEGEEMFVMHGYSGPCPGPPLPKKPTQLELVQSERDALRAAIEASTELLRALSDPQLTVNIPDQIAANEAALMKGSET